MNLLDPYEPPFKPKRNWMDQWFNDDGTIRNQKELEEVDRPLVTEDYEDSPFADRKPMEKPE